MKRLRDTEPDSPLSAQARTLLESVEPLAEDEARLQRVRRALDAAERIGGVRGARRWPALGLAAAFGLFGASAFAAVAFVAQWRADEPAQAPVPQQQTPAKSARRAPAVAEAEPEAAQQAEPTAATAEPVADERDRAPRRPVVRGERRPSGPEQEPEVAQQAEEAADSPHSALVHEALQALRHQHDPARAARLLQSYATLAPQGPLAEEALSLRIEALQALGDARARALATQYLHRYPAGRYAAVARRALAPADPAP